MFEVEYNIVLKGARDPLLRLYSSVRKGVIKNSFGLGDSEELIALQMANVERKI